LTKEDDKEEAPSPIKNIYEKSDDQQQNMTWTHTTNCTYIPRREGKQLNGH
jgi:hypothetical protein